MKRLLMPALAGVLFAGALTTLAGAQTPNNAPDPKSSQAPTYFAAGDYVFNPNVTTQSNRYGTHGKGSYAGRVGAEIPFKHLAVMAEGDLQNLRYDPAAGTQYRTNTYDGKLGIGLNGPNVFLAASYLSRSDHEGVIVPNIQGWGFGVEKLPEFNQKIYSFYGSYYYYPQVGSGTVLQYHVATYRAGVELHPNPISHNPLFLDIGFLADHGSPSKNAPVAFDDQGIYTGLGLHF